MTARHNPFVGFFDNRMWPLTDTRPNKQIWKSYGPGRSVDPDYRKDYHKFNELGRGRRSFIRFSDRSYEPPPTGWDSTGIPILLMWVVVFQIAHGWHVELPFFRGPKPYDIEPSTDSEVASIVSECIAIGGYECNALEAWQAAVAAKQ